MNYGETKLLEVKIVIRQEKNSAANTQRPVSRILVLFFDILHTTRYLVTFDTNSHLSTLAHKMNIRQQLTQFLTMAYVFLSAFVAWKTLGLITNSHSPIVVVLSGSMLPPFDRGDILLLWNRDLRAHVGDIVVYDIANKSIPIVHRVLREHHTPEKQLLLTKGDNNFQDDLPLYAKNQAYLDQKADIVGTAKFFFPKLGYVTILLSENQYFKFGLLALMGISAIISGEA